MRRERAWRRPTPRRRRATSRPRSGVWCLPATAGSAPLSMRPRGGAAPAPSRGDSSITTRRPTRWAATTTRTASACSATGTTSIRPSSTSVARPWSDTSRAAVGRASHRLPMARRCPPPRVAPNRLEGRQARRAVQTTWWPIRAAGTVCLPSATRRTARLGGGRKHAAGRGRAAASTDRGANLHPSPSWQTPRSRPGSLERRRSGPGPLPGFARTGDPRGTGFPLSGFAARAGAGRRDTLSAAALRRCRPRGQQSRGLRVPTGRSVGALMNDPG